MVMVSWLKTLFEPQAHPKLETAPNFKVIFSAREKSIRVIFKTQAQDSNMHDILDKTINLLPDQNAFYNSISIVSGDQKSRITVYFNPKNPDDVSTAQVRTLAQMISRNLKRDFVPASVQNSHFLAPLPNTLT